MSLSDFRNGEQQGIRKGRIEARTEALNWLRERYMATPDTETPEGKAILEVTRELSKFLRVRAGVDSLDG